MFFVRCNKGIFVDAHYFNAGAKCLIQPGCHIGLRYAEDCNSVQFGNDITIRTGTIIDALPFEKAEKPAYKNYIDLDDQVGLRKTSAQITKLYDRDELIGNQVICVINFPPKQIADFTSECLILGVYTKKGVVTLSTQIT
jgi:tRNA-binding protein